VKPRGYILFETIAALAVFSASILVIQAAFQRAIATRALAQDYTQVRFLIDQKMAELELQPQLVEGEESGNFEGDLARFSYRWKVTKITLPEPPIPPDIPPEQQQDLKLKVNYLTKREVTISWSRGKDEKGKKEEHKITVSTIWDPEKLFVPKEEEGPV